MNPLDYSGKTVLVTGGGRGIGRACAEAFAAAGATVAIAEVSEELRADFAAANPDALALRCDVTKSADVAALAATLKERFGKLDVLVNNVGDFLHAKPFETMNDEEIDSIVEINFGQVMRVTRAMLPLLRAAAPGSSIVSVTSIEAFRGIPNCAVYGACKAAVTALSKCLALELAPDGIRINDIAPETTDTPQVALDYMIPPENRAHMDKWIPLGRFGKPEDIAGAALYLASPLASWVTGTTIHVDGGALAAAGWTRTPEGQWTVVPLVSGNGLRIPA